MSSCDDSHRVPKSRPQSILAASRSARWALLHRVREDKFIIQATCAAPNRITEQCRTVIDSVGPVSSPTRRHAVNLARTINLFRHTHKTASVSGFDPLEWVEASTLVAAKRTRTYAATAKFHCEHARSYAATTKFHCEHARSYAATAKFHCEHARSYAVTANFLCDAVCCMQACLHGAPDV